MSATELVCASPSQQRLRRSSDSVAAPSQQRCAQHQLRRSSISSAADATRRMSATELVCAAPSQQRLRRSSVAAALRATSAPSQQHQLRRSSISSVAAGSSISRRRQCPATMSGRRGSFVEMMFRQTSPPDIKLSLVQNYSPERVSA